MRRGRLWGAVLLLLLLCAGRAGAAADRTVTLTCKGGWETVVSQTQGTGQLLCAPGIWDLTAACLSVEGQETLYLGEEKTPVTAGEAADLTPYLNRKIQVWDGTGKKLTVLTLKQGSPLPALFLTVDETELAAARKSKENAVTGGRLTLAEADGSVCYAGEIRTLKGRGNSTFAYSKKPYELKLPEKIAPAGMPGGKTWVLLANYTDISLLRNQIVLDTAREIGLPCAVRCAQADLWINGAYQGLYLLTEKVQIGKNRVNIRNLEEENERLNPGEQSAYPRFRKAWGLLDEIRGYQLPEDPEDITGGYIAKIEKDHRYGNTAKPGFETESRLCVRIVEPTCPSEKQVQYLAVLVDEAQRALMAKDGVHPETGKDWREYWDEDSFAKKYLLEEWCKNFDFLGGSQYFYKDSDAVDSLLYAGPAWDYDLSFGNMESRGYDPRGNYMTSMSRRPGNLYWLMTTQEAFRERVRGIWRDAFAPAMALLLGEQEDGAAHVLQPLQRYADAIRASAEMNFARWGVNTEAARAAGGSFESAVRYLENWIRTRVGFLNEENAD